MPGQSRIVQGGELPVSAEGLEGVVVGTTPKPQGAVASSGNIVDFGKVYTLNERVVMFLKNCTDVNSLRSFRLYDINQTVTHKDILSNPSVESIVKSLGSDFFTLDKLVYVSTSNDPTPISKLDFLAGTLKLNPQISFNSFRQGLGSHLGSDDLFEFLMQTDLGNALGLNDPTKLVNSEDPNLQQYFPDLAQLKNLNSDLMIPADPYLLLLVIKPEYRRFLSACFDKSAETNMPPALTFPEQYQVKHTLTSYGMNRGQVEVLYNSGILGIKTIVEVGKQYEVKDIKQYFDSILSLRNTLRNIRE